MNCRHCSTKATKYCSCKIGDLCLNHMTLHVNSLNVPINHVVYSVKFALNQQQIIYLRSKITNLLNQARGATTELTLATETLMKNLTSLCYSAIATLENKTQVLSHYLLQIENELTDEDIEALEKINKEVFEYHSLTEFNASFSSIRPYYSQQFFVIPGETLSQVTSDSDYDSYSSLKELERKSEDLSSQRANSKRNSVEHQEMLNFIKLSGSGKIKGYCFEENHMDEFGDEIIYVNTSTTVINDSDEKIVEEKKKVELAHFQKKQQPPNSIISACESQIPRIFNNIGIMT